VISYTYATDGTKLRALYATGTNNILSPIGVLNTNVDNDIIYSDSTVYCDNSIYVNGKLDKILLPDGYVQVTYRTIRGRLVAFYDYYYTIKDHQGSARINIAEEYLDNRPSEGCRKALSYYPFGKAMNNWISWVVPFKDPYTYTGKKEETMHSLGWYDYGKRFYDPNYRLSFISIDPLCEKYYSISPYVYCANNPIRYVDLQGDSLILSGNALDIQTIASTYNLGLGGFYTTSADAIGKMSISPVAGTDPNKMTAEQKAYYSALDKVISGTDGMTTINVANGTSVVIGDVNTSTIDIRDIQVLGNGTDINQGSALLHETIEQYGVQIKGQTPTVAHLKASGAERMVTGSYADPINRFLVSGQLSVPILDPATGNTLKTVIIYVNNSGNVIGIRR
jgi:RHS repeat-associated protein